MEKRGNIRSVPTGSQRGESFRTPPHDLDAERSVVGAVLVSPHALDRVQDIVEAEDFYSETHRIVYAAALAVSRRGEPVDQITVSDELRRVLEFDRIGGRGFVFELVESVPTASNAHRYAEIVREKSILRNLIDAGSRIAEDAFREPEDIGVAIEEAEQMIYEIARSGASEAANQSGARSMTDLVAALLETTQARYESGVMPGISTGFGDLDTVTNGLNPGELIVVAARPAMGKSAFAVGLAKAAARAGNDALIFSLEMSSEQLTARMVSEDSGIPVSDIVTGQLKASDWTHFLSASSRVGELAIVMDDRANQSITEMRSKIRRESAKLASRGRKLSLVVVDYLQLMVGDRSRNSESRQYEVGDISRGLKVMAREFDVPVIALSQLSRACEQRTDKRPMLSDLRDSGSIEQDSDKVMFLYRDEYYDPETDDRGIAEVIVAKHRNGPTGKVKLAWRAKQASFASLAR